MVSTRPSNKVTLLSEVHAKCAPKPINYPDSSSEYLDSCVEALLEARIRKQDFEYKRTIPERKFITRESAIIRASLIRMAPYLLVLLVAMAVTTTLYLPAVVALFFFTGSYLSKVALDLNAKLKAINQGYIKAMLFACIGLTVETVFLLIARIL